MDLGCSTLFPHTFTEERIKGVNELGELYSIKYGLNTASYVNTAEIMPEVRGTSEEHLLEYIRLSSEIAAEYCVIHCGYHFCMF